MAQSSLQYAPTTAFVSSEMPLTVKDVARYLGGSPQTVYLWEEPSFGTVGAEIGQMEQQFCWEVLYNLYVRHVGA